MLGLEHPVPHEGPQLLLTTEVVLAVVAGGVRIGRGFPECNHHAFASLDVEQSEMADIDGIAAIAHVNTAQRQYVDLDGHPGPSHVDQRMSTTDGQNPERNGVTDGRDGGRGGRPLSAFTALLPLAVNKSRQPFRGNDDVLREDCVNSSDGLVVPPIRVQNQAE